MNINSFVMSYDLMRGQMDILEAMDICIYEAIHNFMMAKVSKSALRNTFTENSKIKTDQQ